MIRVEIELSAAGGTVTAVASDLARLIRTADGVLGDAVVHRFTCEEADA